MLASERDGRGIRAYVEDRVSRKYRLADYIAYMVRRVAGKVDDARGEFAELELLVVLKVDVEGVLEERRVVETVHGSEYVLYLGDAPADADGHLTAEVLLQVLRRGEVVCMRVRFPRGGCVRSAYSG